MSDETKRTVEMTRAEARSWILNNNKAAMLGDLTLAKKMGLSTRHVRRVLAGSRPLSQDFCDRYCKAFNRAVRLELTDDPKRPAPRILPTPDPVKAADKPALKVTPPPEPNRLLNVVTVVTSLTAEEMYKLANAIVIHVGEDVLSAAQVRIALSAIPWLKDRYKEKE